VEVKNDLVLMDAARKVNVLQAKVDSHCKECARKQQKEVEMIGLEVQAQLREREKQKETELQLLCHRLEDAVVKQEKMQALVFALKSAKSDVQDVMMDCITSLQAELKRYEEIFIKLQKEANERYEAKLKVYRLQSKDELEEHLAYQEKQTQKVRDLIEMHQEPIDHICGKLD